MEEMEEEEIKKKLPVWAVITAIVLVCAAGILIYFGVNRPKREELTAGQETATPAPTPRGHNEDEDSNLGAWGRAMGAVLITMNDGDPYYFGGYEANQANKKAAARILKQSWGIKNRKELLQKIQWLLETGDREAYLKEEQDMERLSRKEWETAYKQLSGGLRIYYQNLRNNYLAWGKRGMIAWDLCRVSHLVQWGYIAGYVDLEEAQALIEPAASSLKEQFTNWEDVTENWLDGYALAKTVSMEQPASGPGVTASDYFDRKEIYETLAEDQERRGVLFDDELFHTDIVPLETVSFDSVMEELKPKETPEASGKHKKKTKKSPKETPEGTTEPRES